MARKLLLINRRPTQNKPGPFVTCCAIKLVACEKRVPHAASCLASDDACLPRSRLCNVPGGFYLPNITCLVCAPCPAPLTLTPSCGPGPEPGVCLGGLRVTVSIDGAGASPVNVTLALSNYLGVACPVQEDYSVTAGRHPCLLHGARRRI